MVYVTSQDATHRPTRLPDLGSAPNELLDFRDRFFNFYAVYRCRHMERMAMNLNYQLGRQWLELDNEILMDGVRGYVFRDLRQAAEIDMPRPVTNYIAPAVEVEMASLGKRELSPNVLASSKDPRIEAAAQVAKEILQYRMKVLNWPEIRELATFLTIVTGTGCIRSLWDETYNDLTPIGSPNAASCPSCGTLVASTTMPSAALDPANVQNRETVQKLPSDDPNQPDQVQLTNCPTCTTPTPLKPYQVNQAQAEMGVDFMGRPLGLLVPKGNTCMEVVSPFELFPENCGVGITPDTCRVWGQASPRNLDWVEERWPDKAGDVIPEPPTMLMRYHPIMGEWTLLGRFDAALDSGIYDNHCRVYEIHAEKSYRFPQGRSIVIAGNIILEDGPLYRTVTTATGEQISAPRVSYSAARYGIRHGEFWGKALVDDLISPQNQVNGIKAQMIETRERMGSPNLLVPDDSDLSGPEWFQQYGSGKIMRYTLSAINPNSKPEAFGGEAMPPETYKELEQTINDMKQVAGPQDIEVGEAPRNISTTSGLQLLGEQAERRRAPRERALCAMYEKVWSHQLKLLWAFRTESDDYEVEDKDGSWETKQFDREAIQGQCKVEVEKQAYVDKSLYQREGTREAQADGLYVLNSQAAVKKVLEYRGLPTDVNEDLNYQVDLAKQQWVDFMDEGDLPVVDESIDDFQIRFQVLGTFLLSDEGQRLEKSVQWNQVLKVIAGWEQELQQAEAVDMAAVQLYGSRTPDPQMASKVYAQATLAYQHQVVASQKMQAAGGAMAAAAGQPPMPQTPPPSPPPPPVFLPAAKQDRIYMIWKKMILGSMQQQQMQQPPQVDPTTGMPMQQAPPSISPELDQFLQFRACVDAYRLLARDKAMSAAMGVPPAGVPGTPGGPGAGPGQPGLDFQGGPNPPNPVNPAPAPGVGVQHA